MNVQSEMPEGTARLEKPRKRKAQVVRVDHLEYVKLRYRVALYLKDASKPLSRAQIMAGIGDVPSIEGYSPSYALGTCLDYFVRPKRGWVIATGKKPNRVYQIDKRAFGDTQLAMLKTMAEAADKGIPIRPGDALRMAQSRKPKHTLKPNGNGTHAHTAIPPKSIGDVTHSVINGPAALAPVRMVEVPAGALFLLCEHLNAGDATLLPAPIQRALTACALKLYKV